MIDWDRNIPPIVGNKAIGTKNEDPKTLALSGEKPFVKPPPPKPVQSHQQQPPQRREEPRPVKSVVPAPVKPKPKKKTKSRHPIDLSTHTEYINAVCKKTGVKSISDMVNFIIYDYIQSHPI